MGYSDDGGYFYEHDDDDLEIFAAAKEAFEAIIDKFPSHGTDFKTQKMGKIEFSIGRGIFANIPGEDGSFFRRRKFPVTIRPEMPEEHSAKYDELMKGTDDHHCPRRGTFSVIKVTDTERDISATMSSIVYGDMQTDIWENIFNSHLSLTIKGTEITNLSVVETERRNSPLTEELELESEGKGRTLSKSNVEAIIDKVFGQLGNDFLELKMALDNPPKSTEEKAVSEEIYKKRQAEEERQEREINNALSSL